MPRSANTRPLQTQIALFSLGGLVGGVLAAMLLEALGRKAAIGGGILALVAFAALCSAAPNLVGPQLGTLAIFAPLAWLVWKRPETGLLGLVALAVGILPVSTLYVRLPVGGLFGSDVILIGLLGLLSMRALVKDGLRIEWGPVTKPLLVFVALAVTSTVYAVSFREGDLARSLNELRPIVYFSTSIVAALALKRRSHRTVLLIGLFILSDVISGALLFQQFAGAGHFLLPGMAEWQVNEVGAGGDMDAGATQGSAGFGLVRIVPPAIVLMFVMMMLAFVWTLAPGVRRWARIMCAAQWAVLNVGLLLTYTRAEWIASVVAVTIITLLAPHALRVRIVCAVLGAVGFGMLAALVLVAGVQLPGAVQPAVEALLGRAISILTPDATLSSASLQWRAFETEQALNSLLQSPAGVGLGNTYRAITTYAGEAAGWQGSPLNGFVHNSYLYIAVKTGLQGLVAFVWFCFAFLANGWRLFRRMPAGPERWLVLSILASFLSIMQWSFTEANFMQMGATVTVGLMVGLLASLTRPATAGYVTPDL